MRTLAELVAMPHGFLHNPEGCSRRTAVRVVEFIEGLFVGSPLNFGENHKLDKSCARFSLLAGLTCPPECTDPNNPQACGLCGCYGIFEENFRKEVNDKDVAMTYLALTNIPLLERYIRQQLDRRPSYVTSLRIHERGDFVAQEYIDMWVRIAKDYPELMFYCYTKWRYSDGSTKYNWNEFDKYITWHPSDIHGFLNYGPKEYIDLLHKLFPNETYICRFNETHAKCGTCKGSCKACHDKRLSGRTPLFEAHGAEAIKKTKVFYEMLLMMEKSV